MIARITNFSSKENQIIEWEDRIPRIQSKWNDFSESMFNRLLEQFNLLLDKYPNSLRDDVILKKQQELKKYAKDNKTAISNCYSYCNKDKENSRTNTYGIRIVPKKFYSTVITITSYNSTSGL